jgi:lipopolysaccharide/colanic/teichoic acid biosynthesis glycosyltransferase
MKRILDFFFCLLVLIPTFFLMVGVGLLIVLVDGRPLFFSQVRAGYLERPFRIWKFRSMSNAVDENGKLLPDAARLTAWGRFLRASSLDELPQLWSVFRGDMSLVGPRPLPISYLPRYSDRQRKRHSVMPGITGWAQVNGRNSLTWDQKFELDIWYVEHRSLALDLRILLMTALRILRPAGISARGEATMTEFLGKADNTGRE